MGFFKKVIWSSMLMATCYLHAQISEGGTPPSFKYGNMLRSAVVRTQVPVRCYSADMEEVDNWRARQGELMPIAQNIEVDYTMENSGEWTTLPGGENIWQLSLKAKDAVAIMLYYKDFYIPEGGKLFIYNADKTQILGAYTHDTHPNGGLFSSEFVAGDELTLEYVASTISNEKPRIEIEEIGYGYNKSALREFCNITTRSSAGSCEVSINCEEGDAWQNEKKSICYIVQKIGSKSYICSGVLMNNTAQDFKPLILSARHCAYANDNTIANSNDMKQWLFYFHKEREGCSNSSVSLTPMTMTGCKLLAKTETDKQADGMLLCLDMIIPENYDVYYSGWDRRDLEPTSGVCIHHPQGDYMKISTYKEKAVTTDFVSSLYTGYKNAHLSVKFSKTKNGHGVTADGSSGSPLYNQNKLVVATLTGGNSSCSYTSGINLYAKLAYNWDKFETDSTRMDIWLDPINSGVETLQGRFRKELKPAPTNLKAVNQGQSIYIEWNKPENNEVVVKYYVYRNNERIGETKNLNFVDNDIMSGSILYSVSAVYASDEESAFASVTLLYVEYKTPTFIKAEKLSSGKNKITWDIPTYEQTIIWGNYDMKHGVGFKDRPNFYFGQRWTSSEISPLSERTITAVQYVPMDNNRYEIFITQGARIYSQKINSMNYGEINTVKLDTPFVIDGTNSLIVSIYVSKVGMDYPAVCDAGPAVDGKGNVFSYNGKDWNKLYNEQVNPNDFDYNFLVSAIVSSVKGEVPASEETSDKDEKIKPKSDISNQVRSAVLSSQGEETPIATRSSVPSAFPEIRQFNLYRSNVELIKKLEPTVTEYIDGAYNYVLYQISATYEDGGESEKITSNTITGNDGNEFIDESITIYPTIFADKITLKGSESVSRIDIVSIDGKICMNKDKPDNFIDVSELSQGFYIIRIYGHNNELLKAVKCTKR